MTAVLNQVKERNNVGTSEIEDVKLNALIVAKKTILDLLAKCYQNSSIRQMIESLKEMMNQDEGLCFAFLDQCFREDQCNYLFEVMLECTD